MRAALVRVLWLWVCTFPVFAAASPAALVAPPPDALLLAVRLDSAQVSDAMPALEIDGELYLPLAQLASALTLAIEADPAQGTASGFVLTPERSFYLDARAGVVVLAGQSQQFDPARVRIADDDIYVSHTLLAAWLPVDLAVDMASLWLLVHAREELPMQARRSRERRGGALPGDDIDDSAALPRHASPYALVDMPTIDQSIAMGWQGSDEGTHADARVATYATGDLLHMSASAYAAASTGTGPTTARLTLARRDPEGELLGPLHARSLAIGSVPVTGVANVIESSALGTGLELSNYPLSRPQRFDTQSLSGPLPPGWDVELYYNDALIAWRQADATGIYDFGDLPLQFGINEFRLVFRGPQGQFREETQSFHAADSLTPPGQSYYRLAAHPWADHGVRALAQFDWGAFSRLSLTGGATWLAEADSPYASLGVRMLAGGTFVTLDGVRSPAGDWLEQVGLRTRVGAWSLAASHVQVGGFSSNLFPTESGIEARTDLRIVGTVPLLGLRVPLDLDVRHDTKAGQDAMQIASRVSGVLKGTALTHQLQWRRDEGGDSLHGSLQFTRRFDRFGLRAQMSYSDEAGGFLNDVSMSFEQRTPGGWLWSLGFDRSLVASESKVSMSANRTFDSFSLGARGVWSSADALALSLNMFVALGKEPRSGTWRAEPTPIADGGAVSARAFLDRNSNGARDADEPLLPGVAFNVNGGRQRARTGEAGVAMLERLPANQVVRLAIESGTLEDPYWQPSPSGVELVPRPGKVLAIEFPVVPTTVIDGTVQRVTTTDDGDRRTVVAGRQVELRDADGRLIARTTTASDGYYLLEGVPPGSWQLGVVAIEGEVVPPPRTLVVSADDNELAGTDIVLELPNALPSDATRVAANDGTRAPSAGAHDGGAVAVDPGGVFAVQTGAFMSIANAERYAAVVEALGASPRIETYLDVNRVRWYRVRVGRMADLGSALAVTDQLRATLSEHVIPVTTEPLR